MRKMLGMMLIVALALLLIVTLLVPAGAMGGTKKPADTVKGFTGDAAALKFLYTLTVNTAGSGSVTKAPDQATYTYGTVVTLTATANAGSTFAGWSGNLTGTTNPATITMDSDKIVTANFPLVGQSQFHLTVFGSTGATVRVNPDPPSHWFDPGTSVTLTVTPPAGYSFLNWTGDLTGNANPVTFVMNANKTVMANFTTQTQYTLTVNTAGSGSVTKAPDQATYAYGAVVTLTAIANAGSTFAGWSGDLTGTTNPVTFVMNANKTVMANFTTQTLYTLTVNTAGSGSVTKAPNQTTYTYGTVVTLTATADAGSTFAGWSGNLTGTTNPVNIVMNANKTVTANFTEVKQPTTTTVDDKSATYSKSKQNVTLKARVVGSTTVREGKVTFTVKKDSTTIGSPTVPVNVNNGQAKATYVLPGRTGAGSYTIEAAYSGGDNFGPSNGSGTLTVNKASTTTKVRSSRNTSFSGQLVTFIATVTSSRGKPTGKVTFKDGGRPLGEGTLDSSGKATYPTSSLSVGTHSITAVYEGDDNFKGSTSPTLRQRVR
jgi:uncharacterized repeat protein (TIGR02543 family)